MLQFVDPEGAECQHRLSRKQRAFVRLDGGERGLADLAEGQKEMLIAEFIAEGIVPPVSVAADFFARPSTVRAYASILDRHGVFVASLDMPFPRMTIALAAGSGFACSGESASADQNLPSSIDSTLPRPVRYILRYEIPCIQLEIERPGRFPGTLGQARTIEIVLLLKVPHGPEI